MNKTINDTIARYFLNDSREFLKRYEFLRERQTDISNRSKLLIDLVFSLECSLKALIFIESDQNEKQTYKKIKSCSHNLKKLLENVNTETFSEIVSKIDSNIEHFSISSRYSLEANIYFRDSMGALNDLYYNTIANFLWLDDLHKQATELYKYVISKIDNSLKTTNFDEINAETEMEIAKRLKEISYK